MLSSLDFVPFCDFFPKRCFRPALTSLRSFADSSLSALSCLVSSDTCKAIADTASLLLRGSSVSSVSLSDSSAFFLSLPLRARSASSRRSRW